MKLPERENTDRIALKFVLVASIVSRPCFQRAVLIATLSAWAGAPGETVSVAVRVMSNQRAVIVTLVVADTADVLTGKVPRDWPPFTTTSCGTWATAGLLLESCTLAPSVAAVNVTVPVAEDPPVRLDGLSETADSEGPAGWAALTDRLAERG